MVSALTLGVVEHAQSTRAAYNLFQKVLRSAKHCVEMTRFGQIFEKLRGKRWFIPALASTIMLVLLAGVVVFAFRPVHFDSLIIHGSHRFKTRVLSSLTLLRTKAPEAYQIVTNNIGAIAQSKHSGMAVYRKPPTFELNDATAYASVTWCASCIAHDALHARFYFTWLRFHASQRAVPHDVWMGENAEMLCSAHQLRVLRQIGAASNEIAHCSSVSTNRYWEVDYKKRNW
jgi:hypothetical protein